MTQRDDCLEKLKHSLGQFEGGIDNQQDGLNLKLESGKFPYGVSTGNSVNESELAKQKQNQAVLDHLYKNVYRFNSGVFNYDKKMN